MIQGVLEISASSAAKVTSTSTTAEITAATATEVTSTTAEITAATTAAKVATGASPTSITLTLLLRFVFTCLFAQFITQKATSGSSKATSGPGIHTRDLIIAWSIGIRRVALVIGRLLIYWRTIKPAKTTTPAEEDTKEQDCAKN
jgi:hypothetical protein